MSLSRGREMGKLKRALQTHGHMISDEINSVATLNAWTTATTSISGRLPRGECRCRVSGLMSCSVDRSRFRHNRLASRPPANLVMTVVSTVTLHSRLYCDTTDCRPVPQTSHVLDVGGLLNCIDVDVHTVQFGQMKC